jgi:hypothetical protein
MSADGFHYFLLVQKVIKKDTTPKNLKFTTRRAPALIWRLNFEFTQAWTTHRTFDKWYK